MNPLVDKILYIAFILGILIFRRHRARKAKAVGRFDRSGGLYRTNTALLWINLLLAVGMLLLEYILPNEAQRLRFEPAYVVIAMAAAFSFVITFAELTTSQRPN